MQDARLLVERIAAARWRNFTEHEAALRQLAATCDVVPALIACAGSPDRRVRAVAFALMDHLADDRCVPAFRAGLRNRYAAVRRQAVHALGCRRCKTRRLDTDAGGGPNRARAQRRFT